MSRKRAGILLLACLLAIAGATAFWALYLQPDRRRQDSPGAPASSLPAAPARSAGITRGLSRGPLAARGTDAAPAAARTADERRVLSMREIIAAGANNAGVDYSGSFRASGEPWESLDKPAERSTSVGLSSIELIDPRREKPREAYGIELKGKF